MENGGFIERPLALLIIQTVARVLDGQQRFENGRLTSAIEIASRFDGAGKIILKTRISLDSIAICM